MKAIITYASWFGHNRAIAEALSEELARLRVSVACVPAYRITGADLMERDLLVMGTYTHIGHASRKLRQLCEAIPQKQMERLAVAIFGTQLAEGVETGAAGGLDELVGLMGQRGCELVIPPLRVGLSRHAAVERGADFDASVQRQIREFACDLRDACVLVPFI